MKHCLSRSMVTVSLVVALVMILGACGATPVPTVPPTAAPPTAVPATHVPSTATAVPPTPTAEGPTVGGTLVMSSLQDPDTLDPHLTSQAISQSIMDFLGGTLVSRGPDGNIAPYLATGWKTLEDGVTWEFTLQKGVQFHDGTPLTAGEFVWTLKRGLDPETKSPVLPTAIGAVASIEAPDDYTLRIKLASPNYGLLVVLASSFAQPLPSAAVQAAGAQFGRKPIGVGPYRFKEWQTGTRVVIERNPDYTWGPAYAHAGPYYIQNIEWRIIPESSTIMAGLESGEIDRAGVPIVDLDRIRETGKFQVFEGLGAGINPWGIMNVSKPPFDDIKVRQAFNYAVDVSAMIKVAASGQAVEQHGFMSPAQMGYWAGVESIGYPFSLDKAKALMAEAGYTMGQSGLLEKDGQPLKLTLVTYAYPQFVRPAEVLQQQLKALGVGIEIQTVEQVTLAAQARSGDFQLALWAIAWADAGVLMAFHSSMIGVLNSGHVNDPELDKLVLAVRTARNAEQWQKASDDAQKRIVEQAYIIGLYNTKSFSALNKRVKGAVWSEKSTALYLNDAYIE